MAIPIIYNLLSLRERWSSALVAVLGIAGTVGVFVAVLALARGFQATLATSGSPENAIVLRAGANAEMVSDISLDQIKIVKDFPEIVREKSGVAASAEVVVIAAVPLKKTGSDANAQIRGVSPNVLEVRKNIRMTEGRVFTPGLSEIVIGKNIASTFRGFDLGQTVEFGGSVWKVVGIFDAKGSAFDSEIWADTDLLNQAYQRPPNSFQSMTVRLKSADAFAAFKDTLTSDRRLTLQAEREPAYYAEQSEAMTGIITVLGSIIAVVMALGAIFGALNTMYSAVAAREREIATMRAVGFGSASVVVSFIFESLMIASIGAIIGCLVVLPLNGVTTAAINFQSFSQLVFAFRIDTTLMGFGIVFGLLMGLVGGLFPAIRAARRPIVVSLREL